MRQPSPELVRQAEQVRARLLVLKPDAFPHQHTPWTSGEVDRLVELAAGTPWSGRAETAAHVLTQLAAWVDEFMGDPVRRAARPAERQHEFQHYQNLGAEADRHLRAIIQGQIVPPDPDWGPFAS